MKLFFIHSKITFSPIHSAQVKVPYGGYTCEYCGDFHRTRCDTCDNPPCRCYC